MTSRSNDRYQMDELVSALREAQNVLIFSHISPDGDTIGSALAMKMLLEGLRKRVVLVMDGEVPENLFFLPDIYAFRKPEDVAAAVNASAPGTLALAVDVSCRDRMGAGEAIFLKACATAQIDHHETNPAYAGINVIDGSAPATALLVFRLMQRLDVRPQKEAAVCLYTALSTDTGNFVYESTNAETFLMMAKLMDAGLNISQYSRLLFRRKARQHVALLAQALPTMRFSCGGEVAGMAVSYAQMQQAQATGAHADGVVDYAVDISGVRLAYFARQTEEGKVKFSLRAQSPYRVDEAAAEFDGGGHQLAAGCTLALPLDEAVEKVEAALQRAHARGKQA